MLELEFESSLDFPVSQIYTKVMFNNEKEVTLFVFYDYVLKQYFKLHPFKLNRGINSYLTDDFFEKCLNEGSMNLKDGVEECINSHNSIKNVSIDKVYPYISSYKFICHIRNGVIDFHFDMLSDLKMNQKNVNVEEINYKHIFLEQSMHDLFDVESWKNGIMKQSKMNYSYKSKSFELEDDLFLSLEYLDDYDDISLPKEYYNVLTEDNELLIVNNAVLPYAVGKTILTLDQVTHDYQNDMIVLKEGKLYLYQTSNIYCKISLFDDYTSLPFVVRKEITGDNRNLLINEILTCLTTNNNINIDLIKKLMILRMGE